MTVISQPYKLSPIISKLISTEESRRTLAKEMAHYIKPIKNTLYVHRMVEDKIIESYIKTQKGRMKLAQIMRQKLLRSEDDYLSSFITKFSKRKYYL